MKRHIKKEDIDRNSLSYQFNTALDYMQMAMQTFLVVPFILAGAFFSGELDNIFEIARNNSCTLAEAAAMWSSTKS
jgi:hypothetical protein